jgi:Outer membrane protein beta-barrel domain
MMMTTRGISLGLAAALVLGAAAPVSAQSVGRVSAGGSVALNTMTDSDVENSFSIAPLVRLNPRRGWRLATAFNWVTADLKNPGGGDDKFARLKVRPVMAGIGYTFGPDRTLFNVSVVAGPSFNAVDFHDEYIERISSTPTIDADNSFAIRPGFSVTPTLARRVGLTAFTGYMFNRPKIVYRNGTSFQIDDRWNADSFVLSAGLVYSIF